MKDKKWYFTFGSGQVHAGCFIIFTGTFEEAREKMVHSFNDKWSFQYSKKEWYDENGISQQEKFNLKEIK